MRILLILIVLGLTISLKSQFCKRDYLETTYPYPIENKETIFKKVDTFLSLMSNDDKTFKNWIDTEDQRNWLTPFDEIKAYIAYPEYYTATIVGIMDYIPNEYIVKIQINLCNYPDSNSVSLSGIYNLVVICDTTKKSYKFRDYRTYYISNNLDSFKQGKITYFSRNINKLNKKYCSDFDTYNTQVAKIFKVDPKEIIYFSLKNSSELLNILGWDIVSNMFYAPTGGFAKSGGKGTIYENIIFSGNNNERYDHELIHLYYDELLVPDTTKTSLMALEGTPTYFGGSSGKTYLELKKNLKEFMKNTDSVRIENHYKDRSVNIQIDKHTNYIYAMGAFITELYFKENGYDGLKELANYSDENFIKNVAKHFRVKEKELDSYLRKLISH